MMDLITSLLKSGYMSFLQMWSSIFVKSKTKKQVVFLMSFPNNNTYLLDELSKEFDVIVYYSKTSQLTDEFISQRKEVIFKNLSTFSGLLKGVQDITRSQITICDNYFPLLGAVKKAEDRYIFQIWHATGAIKNFGMLDKQYDSKSEQDKRRFLSVYHSLDYYVVASPKMGEVFMNCYGAKENQMLHLGFPRTDSLFDLQLKEIKNKKRIVYLPTYRENQQTLFPLEINSLENEFAKEYELLIKVHPHIEELVQNQDNSDFVKWQPIETTEELIATADILITDYSSVAFDYSLIHDKGKLLFYWYDEEEYQKVTGIQSGVKESLPGEICYTTESIIEAIKKDDYMDFSDFNKQWNTFNDGQSSERLIRYLKKLGD
ncbi:CDP-glycerol glycerophosphotransferase family protein [Vagococcus sp.]|uniref:CDP-glycerol glycerophosphotransferase family protein n=2 Tax=Vagococcus sp. TaxID=1933889 RepID=UPI002FC72895